MSTKLWKPSSGWILGIEQIHKCSCRNWLQIPPGNSVHWRVRRGLYRNSQFGLFSPKIADVSWESDLVITFPDLQQGVDQGWLKRKLGETQSRCPWPEYRGRRGTHHHESNREPWQALPSLLTDSPHNPAWLWSLLVCFHPTSPISKMKLQDSGIDLSGHWNFCLARIPTVHVGPAQCGYHTWLIGIYPNSCLSPTSRNTLKIRGATSFIPKYVQYLSCLRHWV